MWASSTPKASLTPAGSAENLGAKKLVSDCIVLDAESNAEMLKQSVMVLQECKGARDDITIPALSVLAMLMWRGGFAKYNEVQKREWLL